MTLLYSDVYGEIPLTPPSYDIGRNLIQGAEALYYKGEAGEILIQQQITDNFTFHYANYHLSNRTIISFHHPGFALQSIVALNQDIATHIQGAGNFLLRKEHVIITHNPSGEMSFVFEKDKNYFAFGSSFNLDFVHKYLRVYFQQEEMAKFSATHFFALTGNPVLASRNILDVIKDIIQLTIPYQLRYSYATIKMQEFFVLQLATIFSKAESKIKLSERQLEALEQIRQLILEDITKHYSLKELSKKTHINLHTLKNGFKQVYGLAPYEYRKVARLHKAKELLKQTDKPIKQIAALIDYSSFASFVSAFTNHFGYTPGSVRK